MARGKQNTNSQPLTTAQRLSSIVKSCRDIMRKDKGLNGDLDRLPMLTWIMFLKFLDDMEEIRQQEAKMAGKRFRPAIEPPYRWRGYGSTERSGAQMATDNFFRAAVPKRERKIQDSRLHLISSL
jgi:hypothetical protein